MSGNDKSKPNAGHRAVNRRNILLGGTTLAAASAMVAGNPIRVAQAQQQPAASAGGKKPNILVIFGDDIGQTNVSAYSFGVMGYRTPNIDRLAKEGTMFTDYYSEAVRNCQVFAPPALCLLKPQKPPRLKGIMLARPEISRHIGDTLGTL
jgi:hypothetical protein